jgi:hypothetical protein
VLEPAGRRVGYALEGRERTVGSDPEVSCAAMGDASRHADRAARAMHDLRRLGLRALSRPRRAEPLALEPPPTADRPTEASLVERLEAVERALAELVREVYAEPAAIRAHANGHVAAPVAAPAHVELDDPFGMLDRDPSADHGGPA